MTISRRDILKSGVSTIGLLGAATAFGQVREICGLTPAQPEGPFYPVRDQNDKNNDLTVVTGRRAGAIGTIIYVQGVVTDSACKPVENAVVEIWQACSSGRYNHPGDQDNANALDPNFQYWGITASNKDGTYIFKTIVPGHYSAGPDWIRPPHIHFKVHKRGFHELTTQMYFAGNQYNDADRILQRIPAHEKDSVVVQMIPRQGAANEHDCVFDISLSNVI